MYRPKCLNQAPDYLSCKFTLQSDIHNYPTRSCNNGCLTLPKPNTEKFKQSLIYGPKEWNSLTNELRNAESSTMSFKRMFKHRICLPSEMYYMHYFLLLT